MAAAANGKKRLARGFTVDEAMVNDFRSYLQGQKVKMDEASFTKDIDFVKAMIHYEIDVALFGTGEAQKNLIAKDPQAQFALAQFPDAVKLTELTKTRSNTKGGN
jgi:carboxyl-terminal processing protease